MQLNVETNLELVSVSILSFRSCQFGSSLFHDQLNLTKCGTTILLNAQLFLCQFDKKITSIVINVNINNAIKMRRCLVSL